MMNTEDTLLLEDFVPYHKSLKWSIQDSYYKTRGNGAWLKGEVPYQITSNSVAARQNAELAYIAIENMTKGGILGKNDPIHILEIASGIGLFAINFIKALQFFDKERNTSYSKRLKYLFTDYSRKNLTDALKVPILRRFYERGIVEFCVMDALKPQSLRKLFKRKSEPTPKLVAVVANYIHCCLPVKIVIKKESGYYEKYIRLFLKKSDDTKNIFNSSDIKKHKGNILENLSEQAGWKAIGVDFYTSDMHKKAVEEITKKFPIATVIYPYGSFESLERTLPLLYPGGIVVISDKGYSDLLHMRGIKNCEPSIHGNSFAHSLNFPIVELLSKYKNFSALKTTDQLNSVQTILISNNLSSKLENYFMSNFVKKNANQLVSDEFWAGYIFVGKKEYQLALRFLERALESGYEDTDELYQLAFAYTEFGDFTKAQKYIDLGRKHDYYNKYDYDFRQGYLLMSVGKFDLALNFFSKSLKGKVSEITLYNIGRCYKNLKNNYMAISYYKKALKINPHYNYAKQALGLN